MIATLQAPPPVAAPGLVKRAKPTPVAKAPRRVAYLINQYPIVSHTFIRREIREMESRGIEVIRLSIRPTIGMTVDPADREEATRTFTCLAEPKLTMLRHAVQWAIFHPIRMARALRMAMRLGHRSGKAMSLHIAYLIEATRLAAYLKERNISHVHVHFGTNAAAVAILMKRLAGITFSMTVHGSAELDAPAAQSLGIKVAEAAFTVAISNYTKAQLMRWSESKHWDRIHVVPCTVDDSFFANPVPITEECDRLVFVGRLSPEKGTLLLMEAFAEAVKSRPTAKLVLVGDGPVRQDIENRIRVLGLSENVIMAGWQTELQIREHLKGARALVLPSFYEGLPVVLMESFALGRPVVTTPVGGIPELVKPGENGWLVPAGHVRDLADALKEVLNASADDCNRMGAAGRLRVKKYHFPAVAGDRLERLFQDYVTNA